MPYSQDFFMNSSQNSRILSSSYEAGAKRLVNGGFWIPYDLHSGIRTIRGRVGCHTLRAQHTSSASGNVLVDRSPKEQ